MKAMNTKRKCAVIFDYDGVILDSRPVVRHAVAALHKVCGLEAPTETEALSWLGPSIAKSMNKFANTHLNACSQAQIEQLHQLYFQEVINASKQVVAFPEMDKLVRSVVDDDYEVAIATMKAWSEMDATGMEFLPVVSWLGRERVFAPATHLDVSSKDIIPT